MWSITAWFGGIVSDLASLMAEYSVNTTCFCYAYQPKIPNAAKKLRKF